MTGVSLPSAADAAHAVRVPSHPYSRRTLGVALMLAVAAGILALVLGMTPDAWSRAEADPALRSLIRGMALIKALLATIAAGAVAWRLGFPASNTLLGAYLMGVWLMVAGSVLLWQGFHLGLAAPLFHLGEFTLLISAWRDGRRGWGRMR